MKNNKFCGVGINDSTYKVNPTIDGKKKPCPYYERWRVMIKRCYQKAYQERCQTYVGVTVCKEWHYFMTFRKWMIVQDLEGKDLDKDILIPNNKIYSPKTCCFVSCELNLTMSYPKQKDSFPVGVSIIKKTGKYASYGIDLNTKKRKNLGHFDSCLNAEKEWIKNKIIIIESHKVSVNNIRIIEGLNKHIDILRKRLL